VSNYDPRDYCETNAELAAEVLDREEYADWQRAVAERARLRSIARQRRNERMGAVDVWSDDYRGPAA
jgi:hypothetical protein